MTLDPELSVPAYELTRFINLLVSGQAGFVNGTRLIYPTKEQRLRQLNLIGNLLFSLIFSWILGQRVTDTLCSIKAISKKDYRKIKMNAATPLNFGLLFGAAQNKLKIVEQPIHFKGRIKNESGSKTFAHVFMLFYMSLW